MVAFKRFFQVDKGISICPEDRDARPGSPLARNQYQIPKSKGTRPSGGEPQKQFEITSNQSQARPMSPLSQAPTLGPSSRKPRHIDLLDALFISRRYEMNQSKPLSPTSQYNEDIAERNMTRFLQKPSRKKGVYSRIVSALYQEDVADRNIAKSKPNTRPSSRSQTMRSRSRTLQSTYSCFQDGSNSRPASREKEIPSTELLAQEPVSCVSDPESGILFSKREMNSRSSGSLRPQRSAPNLSGERAAQESEAKSKAGGNFLGVPPAHKQGNTWSSDPLPDSPTLPPAMRREKEENENQPAHGSAPTSPDQGSAPPMKSRDLSRPTSRTGSRKNVRDLSINTELASRGKPVSRITHRAIQPPTPNTGDLKQNPSIAEVMNSPLPSGTPTSVTPLPQTTAKFAEIMDMFKQAYNTSTQAISPHPTFETLQDAIVREVNSHEAFQRVPVPEPGPPFTPSPSQESFEKDSNGTKTPTNTVNRTHSRTHSRSHSRSHSLKDNQLSKLMRKGSLKKHRRGSETRQSISTSIPSKVFRRPSESKSPRRHTDAPPPSPGFFNNPELNQARPDQRTQEQVTYMDLLQRSEQSRAESRWNPDPSQNLGHSQSLGTISSSSNAPSVYYMRAQTSSSRDSRASMISDDGDSDDILQLPSVGNPHQIQGVDENRVTYVAENTTPRNAYRLMSWPRGSSRNVNLKGFVKNENNYHSSSRPTHQIRGVRSVESC